MYKFEIKVFDSENNEHYDSSGSTWYSIQEAALDIYDGLTNWDFINQTSANSYEDVEKELRNAIAHNRSSVSFYIQDCDKEDCTLVCTIEPTEFKNPHTIFCIEPNTITHLPIENLNFNQTVAVLYSLIDPYYDNFKDCAFAPRNAIIPYVTSCLKEAVDSNTPTICFTDNESMIIECNMVNQNNFTITYTTSDEGICISDSIDKIILFLKETRYHLHDTQMKNKLITALENEIEYIFFNSEYLSKGGVKVHIVNNPNSIIYCSPASECGSIYDPYYEKPLKDNITVI